MRHPTGHALVLTLCSIAAPLTLAPAAAEGSTPPQLAALEQNMSALKVNSEVWTELQSTTTTTDPRHGGHLRVEHAGQHESALVSVHPMRGRIRSGGQVKMLLAGGEAYSYSPELDSLDHGRPWVRLEAGASSLSPFFPWHGGAAGETRLAGSGPYAGLLNLLATVSGPVSELAGQTIHGQRTWGFAMTVQPAILFTPRGERPSSATEALLPPALLEVFIDEAGVPLRTVEHEHSDSGLFSLPSEPVVSSSGATTIEVDALERPFVVHAPPRRRTIGFAEALEATLEAIERAAKESTASRK